MKKIFLICCLCFFAAQICAPATSRASDCGADDCESFDLVEEVLTPNRPQENLWTSETVDKYVADKQMIPLAGNQTLADVQQNWLASDALPFGCPFQTKSDCDIWLSKPTFSATVALPTRSLRPEQIDDLRNAIASGSIDMNSDAARPMMARYKRLMAMSSSCCKNGMIEKLQSAGATPGLVYKFLVDDANFYGFTERCMMMTDAELQQKYPRTATANAVSNVRNSCVCLQRDYLDALLAPFDQFSNVDFVYSWTDGLNRPRTVSISQDVRAVQMQLANCQ